MLLWALLALGVCAAAVTFCYFFVDRPVAWFVYDHVPRLEWVKQVTEFPRILTRLALPVLIASMAWWAWRPGTRGSRILLALALSLMVSVFAKDQLKWVFGRYWPETWANQNPSLIHDNKYGFHPFFKGIAYESFPSGHTTAVFSLVGVAWFAWPRWLWRGLGALLGLAIAAALLSCNYHFVSDIIAGGFLGAIIGSVTARFSGLNGPTGP